MDNRKLNGGHSTKSTGIDKRKNQFKNILDEALEPDDISQILKMLHSKAVKDFDVQAAKILLEYYLGKPLQTIDQKNTHEIQENFPVSIVFTKQNE